MAHALHPTRSADMDLQWCAIPNRPGVSRMVDTAATSVMTRDQYSQAMEGYIAEGKARAIALGNRGPLRLDDAGKLHPDILDAYWEHGFYVFEGVVDSAEIEELRADVHEMIDRAPVSRGAALDAKGRPALGRDHAIEPYLFVSPLSDPWGGTDALAGRHQSKMAEARPADDAPADVVYLMFGMCQMAPAALRLYGHPDLLTIAEAINGADFVPYNDAIFVKQAGLGGSVSWHQDGVTHWDAANWDMGIHGFNFQVQLHPSTPANGLWIVPGTHKLGRIDIKAKVEANGGSDRLPDAIPLFCEAGDATIVNRQIVHGSFANTSADPRVSVTFGFHRRSSVLGAHGRLTLKNADIDYSPDDVYSEERIFDRSAVIAVAIDARAQHRPDERRYTYEPFQGLEDDFRYGDETFARVIVDYNLNDLAI